MTAHSSGAFQIINKNVKVCKDITNTTYTWGLYCMIKSHEKENFHFICVLSYMGLPNNT